MTSDGHNLTWAFTGDLRSRAHIAVLEPYGMIEALCGVGLAFGGPTEIRPLTSKWCDKCTRVARRRGVEAWEIGLENDLRGEIAAMQEP